MISWFEPLLAAELLALGGVAGFLAGLLGVGGGMMMVPFVTFFLSRRGVGPALAVKMAIATSMATIVFTSISSLRAHHARGAVRWPIVRAMTPGIIAGGLLAGAGVFSIIKGSGWPSGSPSSSATPPPACCSGATLRPLARCRPRSARARLDWASGFCRRWSVLAARSCQSHS